MSDFEKQAKKAMLSTADSVLDAIGAKRKKPVGARKTTEPTSYAPSRTVERHYGYGGMDGFKPTREGIWDEACCYCKEILRDGTKPGVLVCDEDWSEAESVAHLACSAEDFIRHGRESGEFEKNRKLRAELEAQRREENETEAEKAAREDAKEEQRARREARKAIKEERKQRLAQQVGVDPKGKTISDLKKIKTEQNKTFRKTKREIVERLVGDASDSDTDDVWIVD